MTRPFARFACIDWSGAAGRWHPGIALAVCVRDDAVPAAAPELIAPPGRHWTRGTILDWLLRHADADLLIGIDFSPALPFEAMASLLGSAGAVSAAALWREIDETCAGDAHLAATSFVARTDFAALSRVGSITGARFASNDPNGRMRLVERHPASGHPASCLNLVGAKQVGRSSLTGMRVLHRLDRAIPVWPFEPVRREGATIVEVYTSIAARAAGIRRGSKMRGPDALDAALARIGVAPHVPLDRRYTDHATDAILTAAWLRRVADDPILWNQPDDPVALAEGWTFGVPYRKEAATPG